MLIVKDFFKNPQEIRDYALSLEYFNKNNHPNNIGGFPGHRTKYLNDINYDLYYQICQKFYAIARKILKINNFSEKYERWMTQFSFSYTKKEDQSFKHKDFEDGYQDFDKYLAGVVYLTPNPQINSGTKLYLNENNVKISENIFNNGIFYDSHIEHEPEDNFGDNIENARMVFTTFLFLKTK